MGNGVRIRPLTPEELSTVALLVSRALAAEDGNELPSSVPDDLLAPCRIRIDGEQHWVLVAESESIEGVCYGSPEWDFGANAPVPGVAHLTGLFVEPARWGNGIGRLLLAAAEAEMRRQGFMESRLWAAPRTTRAMRLYESAGWVRTGRTSTDEGGVEIVEMALHL